MDPRLRGVRFAFGSYARLAAVVDEWERKRSLDVELIYLTDPVPRHRIWPRPGSVADQHPLISVGPFGLVGVFAAGARGAAELPLPDARVAVSLLGLGLLVPAQVDRLEREARLRQRWGRGMGDAARALAAGQSTTPWRVACPNCGSDERVTFRMRACPVCWRELPDEGPVEL